MSEPCMVQTSGKKKNDDSVRRTGRRAQRDYVRFAIPVDVGQDHLIAGREVGDVVSLEGYWAGSSQQHGYDEDGMHGQSPCK